MTDEELLENFKRIEDLPVSEEIIGAYLEGNLDYIEAMELEEAIEADSHLSEFIDVINSPDLLSDSLSQDSSALINPFDNPSELEALRLPEVESVILPEYLSFNSFDEDFFSDKAVASNSMQPFDDDSLFSSNVCNEEDNFTASDDMSEGEDLSGIDPVDDNLSPID